MKLDRTIIDRINEKLQAAENYRFGQVVISFIRHEGKFTKIRIESFDNDIEEISIDSIYQND